MAKPNHTPPPGNGQPTAATLRRNIAGLTAQYGACLNTWPPHAQRAHTRLARQLRAVENAPIRVVIDYLQFNPASPPSTRPNTPDSARIASESTQMANQGKSVEVRDV